MKPKTRTSAATNLWHRIYVHCKMGILTICTQYALCTHHPGTSPVVAVVCGSHPHAGQPAPGLSGPPRTPAVMHHQHVHSHWIWHQPIGVSNYVPGGGYRCKEPDMTRLQARQLPQSQREQVSMQPTAQQEAAQAVAGAPQHSTGDTSVGSSHLVDVVEE